MNLKGILLVALLALSGADVGMSQIVAGKALPLTISGVPHEKKGIEPIKTIRITMSGIPPVEQGKINADYPVSKQGTINLPYVGKINVVGKRPEQLARDIEKAYIDGKIYITPTISVMWSGDISVPNVQVVHIGGYVRRPGSIPLMGGITLWKAIQAAGGKTEFGSLTRVRLYRDGKQTTYDMTKEENHSVLLKVNDTIEVPQISSCAGH